MSEFLNANVGEDKFEINKINKDKYHVYLNTEENFIKIRDLLKRDALNNGEYRTRFYTYKTSNEKLVSYVIKGIAEDYEVEDIEQEIIRKGFGELPIANIKRFETTKSKLQNKKLDVWLIQFENNNKDKFTTFLTMTLFLHSKITIEPLRKQDNHLPQCKNCQRFGHFGSNCNMPYRCVKCGKSQDEEGGHETLQCPLNKPEGEKNQESALRCANCKSEGHPASYKKCPKYKELLKRQSIKAETQRQNQELKSSLYRNTIRKGLSYADSVNKTTNVQNIDRNKAQNFSFQSIDSEFQNLLGSNLFAVINRIKTIIPMEEYKRLSESEKKTRLIQLAIDLAFELP